MLYLEKTVCIPLTLHLTSFKDSQYVLLSSKVAILNTKHFRMAPRNAHQKPSVVVLCGPHMQGAQGVNCARQLAMHGVNVTLFVPNFMKVLDELKSELDLFELTEGKKTAFAKGKMFCSVHRSVCLYNI